MPALWRFALIITRDHDLARELVQMTCLRALEKASSYQPGSRLDRWLMTMMINLWRNELRARKVRLSAGTVDADHVLSFDGSSQVEANIFASEVLTTVAGLPHAQRDTVLLVYLEGWSYADAAAELGVPVGTVMSRLASARARLAPLNPQHHNEKASQ